MKISIFRKFGALNSEPVFNSFEIGLRKLNHKVVYHELGADVFVIWSLVFKGRMAENKLIWEYAVKHDIPVIVLEVGCLNRGITWKVSLYGKIFPSNIFESRAKKLDVNLKPWKKTGSNILICGQRTSSLQWEHGDQREWLTNLLKTIRLYTDRHIIFRPHPRQILKENYQHIDVELQIPVKDHNSYDNFDFTLNNIWILINSNSNPGVESLINGCPCIVDQNSLAYELSTQITDIEKPRYDDREEWLEKICHTEWLLSEFEEGIPIAFLLDSI
jgi:hypothetical protein